MIGPGTLLTAFLEKIIGPSIDAEKKLMLEPIL